MIIEESDNGAAMTIGLGHVGIWAPLSQWLAEGEAAGAAAAELESIGFAALWLGNGQRIFEVASSLIDSTRRIIIATGIVNIATHPAAAAAANYAKIEARHPGRLLLGVGGGWTGVDADGHDPSPRTRYERVISYLDGLDAADAPVPLGRRVVGALGPRMTRLAGRRSAGAHTFLTTPEHTRQTRATLGPTPLLVPEQMVVLENDARRAREIAREHLSLYLSKPNYAASLIRLGYTEDDLADGGSDRLVDAVVAWGRSEDIAKRLAEHVHAGADHVAVQVLVSAAQTAGQAGPRLPLSTYRALGDDLRGSAPRLRLA